MLATRSALRHARLTLIGTLAAALVLTVGGLAQPTPAAAASASTLENRLLSWINADRVNRGLVPLRSHSGLRNLAGDRAATMASTNVLKHPDCLSCLLDQRNIQWYGVGEVIAYSSWPWGNDALQTIYQGWKSSPAHWDLLMSNDFNYAGVGLAYRSSTGRTWASIVLSESKDVSDPWARMSSGSRSGDDVTWTWRGADLRLQTHTAGLKDYDVQFKVDGGSWRTILKGTTRTSLTKWNRDGGHWYKLRVRARDERGNVSGWSSRIRVWVP